MKQFLKPTWAKIILTIIILCYSFFSKLSFKFPLKSLYYPPVNCPEGAVCMPPMPEINLSIFILNLIFNLVLSYIISCFVVLIYNKLRNMEEENKDLKVSKIRRTLGIIFTIMGEILIIFPIVLIFTPSTWSSGSDFYGTIALLLGAAAFIGLILSLIGISIGKFIGKELLLARIIPALFLLSIILLIVIGLIRSLIK